MRVTEVSNSDGQLCATLINALNQGRWDVTAKDAEALVRAKLWVAELGKKIAEELSSKSRPSDFKVKSVNRPSSKKK